MSKLDRREYQLFFEEVAQCLIIYGKKDLETAKQMIDNSLLVVGEQNYEDDILFHESPYYWAMHLLYAKEDYLWHKDRSLWPPPDDYIESWFEKIK